MSEHYLPPLERIRTVAARYRGRLVHRLDTARARARHGLAWTLLRNPPSRRLFTQHPPALTEVQRHVVERLATQGVAAVSALELGVDPVLHAELAALVAEFRASERVRAALERRVIDATRTDGYLVKLYPEGPTLEWPNPLLALGLSPPLLDTVNAYLGMWSRLIYLDVWHSIPVGAASRIGSQHWHRDPEDKQMVKIYLYFADAGVESGPLEYVVGSQRGGPYGGLWRWRARASDRYPDEAAVDRMVSSGARYQATGVAGTLIFCDTSGLHRGGVSVGAPRVVATWTYVTPASIGVTARRRYRVVGLGAGSGLREAALWAVGDGG
jgi:hypothetical protein